MSILRMTMAVGFALLSLNQVSAATASSCDSGPSSAKAFTQGFYDWYVPEVGKKDLPWTTALEHSPTFFRPGLAKALLDDAKAQAASPGDIVGLDFDPFLYAQDPADSYSTGSATEKNGNCRVQILAKSGTRPPKQATVAVVAGTEGHWQFQNFEYPKFGDLLTILGRLKADREPKK
jgi:hypothetical protein